MLAHGGGEVRDQVRQHQHHHDDGDVDLNPEPVQCRELRHRRVGIGGLRSRRAFGKFTCGVGTPPALERTVQLPCGGGRRP